MAKISIAEQIVEFNKGRDPERLSMKLRAIRTNPFMFLRGTCHLFYRDLPRHPLLSNAPVTWLCGDLHLQNMGTYKGDNGLVYFDINDFDEAALGPCTWDLLRLLASILVGMTTLKVNEPEALALCHGLLSSYAGALSDGKARWLEGEITRGMIRDLFSRLADRTRKVFLDSRTDLKGKLRRIRLDGKKALPVSEEQRKKIESFMDAFAARQSQPKFFKLLDVARRIAGTGSLGVNRYVMLVEGEGSPDGNYLLDLKEALSSSLMPHLEIKQPAWTDEAARVVAIQNRMQAVSQAFLGAVVVGKRSYIFRDLQPSEDRVNLSEWQGEFRRLEDTIATMGQVLAWAHLRSSGRQGSAITDELIAFAADPRLKKGMVDLAIQSAEQVKADWTAYCESDVGRDRTRLPKS